MNYLKQTSVLVRRAKNLGLAAAGMAMIIPAASSSIINIHSTGYGLSPGERDPNYTLTVNALSNGTATYVAQGATEAEISPTGAPHTGWPINEPWSSDPNANWIGPVPDVVAIAGDGSDTQYVYTTTFDLTGLAANTAQLSGFWTADNYIAQVQLNGKTISTYSSCLAPSPQIGFYFQDLVPFDITSGFQSGVNTLAFTVTNSNCYNTQPLTNPTGLLVDISGTAEPSTGDLGNPVPEPGTWSAAGLGLIFILQAARVGRRRRRVF